MTLFSISEPAIPTSEATQADFALARQYQPILAVDVNEPAPPLVMGFTVIRGPMTSPSSKFQITPPSGGTVIEYAIWYDWDIQHLYDLEHVWAHLNAAGDLIRVEGSMHGLRVASDTAAGLPETKNGRPVLYCEPGKHALWAQATAMKSIASAKIYEACGPEAGAGRIHTGNRFAQASAYTASPRDHRLAKLAMRRAAFVPSFVFSEYNDVPLISWVALEGWIPKRMKALIAALPTKVPHLAALFLDCGDTLIDEATEVKREGAEVVLEAQEIPHAMDAVRELHALGYPMSLVADGPRETFENLLVPRGIWPLLQAHVISGDIGELKPSPKMFAAAMKALGLPDQARHRVVMVGNNLERDIRGANLFGLQSLFVSWSKKRNQTPEREEDYPDRQIATLDQLVAAIDAFEIALPEGSHE